MSDLIGKKQLLTELELEIGETYDEEIICGLRTAIDIVKSRPTVDAVPVVYGHWTEYQNEADKGFHYCSECRRQAFNYEDENELIEILTRFCYNCGAKMDLERSKDVQVTD